MNVTFECAHCGTISRCDVEPGESGVACPHCHIRSQAAKEIVRAGELQQCLLCGCHELYTRKDFPQRLGLAIVIVGCIASSVAWGFYMKYTAYGILLATALGDLLLYHWMGDVTQCYRCGAEYRGGAPAAKDAFRLETHEKYRQQAARETRD